MFREMRRSKQALSPEECRRILHEGKRAVLSLIGDEGWPYCLPVNYFYEEKENCIYIHGAKQGHKIDAIRACNTVCFTVYDSGELYPNDWAYHVKSVIAFGEAELIDDVKIAEEKVRALAARFYPDMEEAEADLRSGISHVMLIAIHIKHMSGKIIHER